MNGIIHKFKVLFLLRGGTDLDIKDLNYQVIADGYRNWFSASLQFIFDISFLAQNLKMILKDSD